MEKGPRKVHEGVEWNGRQYEEERFALNDTKLKLIFLLHTFLQILYTNFLNSNPF